MHLLHLEDSDQDAELIHALLRSRWPQCLVTVVNTEASFQSAVQREDFDLILSDYTIPGYSGLAALQHARAACPDKPFIYLSGTIGEERAVEALRNGATDYVIKDRPARLISVIETALVQVEQAKEKRRAEQKIREQASLLDKAHEAICVTDLERRITYWNASAERLYGWTAAEAQGRDLRELLYADDPGAFDNAGATAIAQGEWHGELRPRPSQREDIVIESFWSVVGNESGSRSIFIIETDITERKRMESQLAQSQRVEMIGLLAGGIAHDMNNVLAPMLTSVELLGALITRPKDRELLETLEASVQHGVELVRQLLDFARGGSGQRREVAVDALVGGVRRLLQNALRAGIDLRVSFPPDLARINADATQIRQVLLNLCINARDAMPIGGTIEISAGNTEVTADTPNLPEEPIFGPHVCLRVKDSGTGIPPHLLQKLFAPFFTTKKAGKGTGLGLANVASIIKSHRGFIQVESTLGVGTTFSLFFPAVARREENDGELPGLFPGPLQGCGEAIMVIEDDDAVRTVIEVILSTRGYRVSAFKEGAEALKEIRQHPERFALVTTDYRMPEVSGMDVVRELRALAVAPKVIVISGMPPDMLEGGVAGRDFEYMSKPITVDGLLGTVRRVLDGKTSGASA